MGIISIEGSNCKIKSIIEKSPKSIEDRSETVEIPNKENCKKSWTEDDIEFIIRNYYSQTAPDIARALNKTLGQVTKKIRKLIDSGLLVNKSAKIRNIYDNDIKKMVFKGLTNEEISVVLDCNIGTVKGVVKRLVEAGEVPNMEPRKVIMRAYKILENHGYSRSESYKIMGVEK